MGRIITIYIGNLEDYDDTYEDIIDNAETEDERKRYEQELETIHKNGECFERAVADFDEMEALLNEMVDLYGEDFTICGNIYVWEWGR